jgi:hypothetical protein
MEIIGEIWQHFRCLKTWRIIARSMLAFFGICWIADASGVHGWALYVFVVLPLGLLLGYTMTD